MIIPQRYPRVYGPFSFSSLLFPSCLFLSVWAWNEWLIYHILERLHGLALVSPGPWYQHHSQMLQYTQRPLSFPSPSGLPQFSSGQNPEGRVDDCITATTLLFLSLLLMFPSPYLLLEWASFLSSLVTKLAKVDVTCITLLHSICLSWKVGGDYIFIYQVSP